MAEWEVLRTFAVENKINDNRDMAKYNEKVVHEIINCIKDGGFPLILDVDKGRVEVLTQETQIKTFSNMLNMDVVESGVASYKWGDYYPAGGYHITFAKEHKDGHTSLYEVAFKPKKK